FLPLLDVPGVRWLLLPSGTISPALAQSLSAIEGNVLFEHAPSDLGGLAGRVAALDLLISSDDLTATLCGAMKRPVWKIQAPNGHWSWLADGDASKVHPTARIFRAAQGAGQLVPVIRASLEQFTGN